MKSASEQTQTLETGRSMEMVPLTHPSAARRMVIGVTAIVVLAVAWYLFRPELLFVNQSVNEGLPTAAAMSSASHMPNATHVLVHGMFHKGAHETSGMAAIHQLANGQRVLRLSDFVTSNGPDVHVYLVAAADAMDSETVKSAGFVDLGSLKGNLGDQNYDIPADLDLNQFRAVTIWCARFGVNFGTAPLGDADSGTRDIDPVTIVAGSFHDGAHATKGNAAILRLADGKRVLRLTGFETSNGPDVRVYLVAADDAMDSETVKNAGHIELGKLKGNIGDQNYDVAEDVDLSKYRAVTIWCARFGVNFGTAPLK